MRGAFAAILAALLLSAALPGAVSAKDLGVRGATWAIAEPDLLAQIETRLVEMERSGELARLEEEARARARMKLEEPDPAPGIAPARERRSRLFDPAIAVARDIRLPDGSLIAPAGTRVNPLERVTLARDLLFVDGRRDAEIAWALGWEEESGRSTRIVLLAGRPLELMRRHRHPFFFDQGGRLAARFGLRLTPSLVAQAGMYLRITEVPVEDREDPGPMGAGPAREPGGQASNQ